MLLNMGIVQIVNKDYPRFLKTRGAVRELEDCMTAELTPQRLLDGKTLEAQLSLAIANEYDFLFIVHIAMNEAGQYLFGYDVVSRNRHDGCEPKFHFNDNPQTETLVRCVLDALRYCGCSVLLMAPVVRNRISKAVRAAIRRINECRLKQMSIFNMM